MLHALELEIDHPTSGQRITFAAPVPEAFAPVDSLRVGVTSEASVSPTHRGRFFRGALLITAANPSSFVVCITSPRDTFTRCSISDQLAASRRRSVFDASINGNPVGRSRRLG